MFFFLWAPFHRTLWDLFAWYLHLQTGDRQIWHLHSACILWPGTVSYQVLKRCLLGADGHGFVGKWQKEAVNLERERHREREREAVFPKPRRINPLNSGVAPSSGPQNAPSSILISYSSQSLCPLLRLLHFSASGSIMHVLPWPPLALYPSTQPSCAKKAFMFSRSHRSPRTCADDPTAVTRPRLCQALET